MADGERCEGCGGTHAGVKMDGSNGVGDLALITIYTKDDVRGERKETYQFPYVLVNQAALQTFAAYRQIVGFKVMRLPDVKNDQ